MRALWLVLWLLLGAWLHMLGVFQPMLQGGLRWLLLATLIGAWALRKVELPGGRGWALVGLVTALVAGLILPAPFRTGFRLAAGGALVLAFGPRWGWLRGVGLSLALIGALWAVQAATVPLFYHWAARYHRIDALTPLFYALLKPIFREAAFSQGTIYIPRASEIYECATTWERLGLLPALLLGAGGSALLAYWRGRAGSIGPFLSSLALYLILRYAAMVGIEVSAATASNYWVAVPLALSFLPFVVFCALVFPLEPLPRPPRPTRHAVTAGQALLGAGLLVAGAAYHDPGARKAGRVLIDEYHSNWEWTTEAFDTRWYGQRAGYNYYSLGQFLRHYYHVETSRERITPQLLSSYDILFIKTPTMPFQEDELDAIEQFVRRGGGLLLDGDHTNVFGTSTYMNPLARRFGLRFRYDSTYDLSTMSLSVYEAPLWFRHPVVLHVPPYLFATSCTLEAPFLSEDIILGYGLKSMALDYSQRSFFAENKSVTHYDFGVFLQAGGVRYGKGRVLGYTDSTCFSNFFMFIPGKPELVLGMLDWLNRANRRKGWNVFFLVVGLGFLGAALRRAAQGGRPGGLSLVVGGTWGCLAAGGLCTVLARGAYPEPRPRVELPTVAFEAEHSRYELPVLALTRTMDRSLHTFYVWVQRLNLFPKLEPSLEGALRVGRMLVVANPGIPFTQSELDSVVHFVRRGGHLLILDDPRNDPSSTDQILGLFGMRRDTVVVDSAVIRNRQGESIAPARWAGAVLGGKPLLWLSSGAVVAAEDSLEAGTITVFMNSYAFTDAMMGATGANPDARQRRLYELEYWLLRRMEAKRPGAVPLLGPASG